MKGQMVIKMAKKKNKMISTQGFVSTEDKRKKQRNVHISVGIPHGISCETQLYAKSIASVHKSKKKYSSSSTKGENTRRAGKNIDPSKHL